MQQCTSGNKFIYSLNILFKMDSDIEPVIYTVQTKDPEYNHQVKSDLEARTGILSVEIIPFKQLPRDQLRVHSTRDDFEDLWGAKLKYGTQWVESSPIQIPENYRDVISSVTIERLMERT